MRRARQTPTLVREEGENRDARLMDDAKAPFFDATRLEVATSLQVDDGVSTSAS